MKIEYRRLCKQWHPDLGTPAEAARRTAIMQEVNAEHARASAVFRQEEIREKARERGRPEPTQQDYTDAAAVDERIRRYGSQRVFAKSKYAVQEVGDE